eukprot:6480672-Amphidinium_carterae.2
MRGLPDMPLNLAGLGKVRVLQNTCSQFCLEGCSEVNREHDQLKGEPWVDKWLELAAFSA